MTTSTAVDGSEVHYIRTGPCGHLEASKAHFVGIDDNPKPEVVAAIGPGPAIMLDVPRMFCPDLRVWVAADYNTLRYCPQIMDELPEHILLYIFGYDADGNPLPN